MLKLVEPSEEYISEYKEAYLLSLDKIEKGLMRKHNMMFMNPDEIDVIQRILDDRDQSKLPDNYVPSYDYFAVEDGKFIGIIFIRIRLTDELLRFGGHIGYGTNPKYWQQGYGTEILKLGLEKIQELIDVDKVLITCDDDNIGSARIIEKNGGVLEDKVMNTYMDDTFLTRRYWIDLNK